VQPVDALFWHIHLHRMMQNTHIMCTLKGAAQRFDDEVQTLVIVQQE